VNLVFATGSGNGQIQQLLSVRNNGDDALNWSATADQSWIHFGVSSGNTPSDIPVTADATGLAVGTYTGNITVASPTVPNSPQVVTVTFNVAGAFLSGRVVDATGNGLGGVTLTLNGPQAISLETSSNGNYSFGSLPAGINYTLVPTKTNYTFSPSNQALSGLSGNQVANFTARINQGVPILVSEPNSTRALALDPVLHVAQPFPLNYSYTWGVDSRSRVMLFATNFELGPSETASAFTAEAEDIGHHIFPLTVEYVGKVPGLDWLNCIALRLNDEVGDVGDVLIRVTYHGVSSNRVRVGIGHMGDGPPDDIGAFPTPGRPPL
jgi:hypothetical protein